MPAATSRSGRKHPDRYHHGDLRHALLQAAVRTIERQGIDALTLRAVGAAVGVSRTALYRHFRDKDSLLAAVAAQGFRTLHSGLVEAWEHGGRAMAAFKAMGLAYIAFGVAHPSHYQVMFGGHLPGGAGDGDLGEAGSAAFRALLDPLVELQQAGLIRRDDPVTQARFVWATVHGVAMLLIAGTLGPHVASGNLPEYVVDRLGAGLAPAAPRTKPTGARRQPAASRILDPCSTPPRKRA